MKLVVTIWLTLTIYRVAVAADQGLLGPIGKDREWVKETESEANSVRDLNSRIWVHGASAFGRSCLKIYGFEEGTVVDVLYLFYAQDDTTPADLVSAFMAIKQAVRGTTDDTDETSFSDIRFRGVTLIGDADGGKGETYLRSVVHLDGDYRAELELEIPSHYKDNDKASPTLSLYVGNLVLEPIASNKPLETTPDGASQF